MDFTPEQQAAIDAEVARQIATSQTAQQSQTAIMVQQHTNNLEIQTASQTAQAAMQAAQAAATLELQTKQATATLELQAAQAAAQMALQARQAKLAAVQLAQSTLIANRNNQPVDAREIFAADITAYAESLVAYVNG
jgi:hypothetical protein